MNMPGSQLTDELQFYIEQAQGKVKTKRMYSQAAGKKHRFQLSESQNQEVLDFHKITKKVQSL